MNIDNRDIIVIVGLANKFLTYSDNFSENEKNLIARLTNNANEETRRLMRIGYSAVYRKI